MFSDRDSYDIEIAYLACSSIIELYYLDSDIDFDRDFIEECFYL